MPHQIEMISLEKLVPANHQYCKFIEVFEFPKHRTTIFYHLKKLGITRKKNHPLRGKK